MKSLSWAEAFILLIYLAMVYTAVRPGSQGPALVKSFGDTLAGLITAATGGGGWSGGGPVGPAGGPTYTGGTLNA